MARFCILLSVLLIFGQTLLFAQLDWAQKVNTTIHVNLDDKNHTLIGDIEIEYFNNSPDNLDYIYFHLYPNAYKNSGTAYAKQQVMMRQKDFHFAGEESHGYIDSLMFKVNGKLSNFVFDENNIDIGKLILPETLQAGEMIVIKTPFLVKLPPVRSRLGYENEVFCLTQWFPKPAVYDKNGWNPMPYLDMGEFFSEFGDYEVNITVRDDYIVAASGNLITKKELQRLEDYAKYCKTLKYKNTAKPFGDSTKYKTISFKETNIHDFAWFASKDFIVEIEPIRIPPSEKTVFCQSFYDKNNANLWSNSINYIKQAVMFFSDEIGEYPYSRCTAVDGPLGAGGGMEYPTITIVNASSKFALETVIIHEIAHNWFYGILASNERIAPWIDEGFTSFYESKYIDKFYPNLGLIENFTESKTKTRKYSLDNIPARYAREIAWLYLVRENMDQSSTLESEQMSMINYFVMSYYKPVTVLYALEKYLGHEEFKAIISEFYETYKFKHIYPETVIEFFNDKSTKPVEKYFTELLIENAIPDYKISGRKGDSIIVKNRRGSAIALLLHIDDSLVIDDGFIGKKKFEIKDAEQVVIDKDFLMPDYNRNNNYYRKGFLKPGKPVRLKPAAIVDNPQISEIPILPIIAYNFTDSWMPGILFYSTPIPKKKFEYFAAPLLSTSNLGLRGTAGFSYYWHPKKSVVREFELFGSFQSFGLDDQTSLPYNRLSNGLKIKFETDERFFKESELMLRNVIASDYYNLNNKIFQHIAYSFSDFRVINPWSFHINFERGEGFAKIYTEIKQTITYTDKMEGLKLRLFAGKFLHNADYYYGNYNFRLSGNNGSQDYFYDHYFIGRNEDIRYNPQSFWAHQFIKNDGGFSIYTPYGQTNNWLVSLNTESSTPIKFIEVYFNLASCPSFTSSGLDFFYETGIKLNVAKEFICVYFPVSTSAQIWETSNNIYTDNYFQKIRFTLSLDKINLLNYRQKPYLLI